MTALVFTGAAAEEAWPLVRDFHYSGRMPSNIQHIYGLREPGGLFGDTGPLAAIAIFSIPPTRWSEPVLELSRLVRRPDCQPPLSCLLASAVRYLRRNRWNFCVSFADNTQNHFGGIYQAAGWLYHGFREPQMDGLYVDGEFVPGRSANSRWGTRSPSKLSGLLPSKHIEAAMDNGKFLYWKPIHRSGYVKAKRLGLNSEPYPKPNAARPNDELVPTSASHVEPMGAAPMNGGRG